jgi:hypothetical protein
LLGSEEESGLLRDNTAIASGVICIVVWSWRTASSRVVSACFKRPWSVGHVVFSVGEIAFMERQESIFNHPLREGFLHASPTR